MCDEYDDAFVIPAGLPIEMRFHKVYYPMRNGIVKIEVSGWKRIGVTA